MTSLAALLFLPLWAVAFALALTSVRLSRVLRPGAVALAVGLGIWLTALIALRTAGLHDYASRLLPSGMLLAAAYVHAGKSLGLPLRRESLVVSYVLSLAIAVIGMVHPSWLLQSVEIAGPPRFTPGLLFWPVVLVSTLLTLACAVWLWRGVWRSTRVQRQGRIALALSHAGASLAAR